MIYCGIDWAEKTHDVALVDDSGELRAKRHITDDAAGYKLLLDLLAEYGDTEEDPIPVAIETSRGLLVAVLRTGKRQVFAINPLAAARYRDRHSVSRKKSDPGDALVLANILRTDMHAHRSLPGDSDLARAIAVLARAQQDATWNRQQMANQLRSLLREYYPAALDAFATWQNGLCRPEARELLKAAPTPGRAAKLTRPQIAGALKRAGRKRGIEADAERIREVFRGDFAHQPPLLEDALGQQMLALLGQLEAACVATNDLAKAVEEAFPQHPDADVILSFPGLGTQLGARVLAEIGDDRTRFADGRGLKAYAGSSPITRASGKKSSITRRWVKNDRLNHVGYLWAFSAITASPGAKAHYRRRRDEHGDWHAAAQRNLFNRMIGQLYHCLQKHELFRRTDRVPNPTCHCSLTLSRVRCLHGLSSGDFVPALEQFLGSAAGLSPATVTRLTKQWQDDHAAFQQRDLAESDYVYVWADGVHPKVRLGQAHSCILVLMGVRLDGTKELVALAEGLRESTESWADLLRDCRRRGMHDPELVVGDGAMGLWKALAEVFPAACHQRCWVHKARNVTNALPKSAQPGATKAMQEIYNAEDRGHAEKAIEAFAKTYGAKFPKAVAKITDDRDELLAFYDFPAEHWIHLRTTNPIESTFSTVKLRTKVTRGAGSPAAALAMVFKLVESAQARWRAVTAPHLVALVRAGARFENGHLVERPEEPVAA